VLLPVREYRWDNSKNRARTKKPHAREGHAADLYRSIASGAGQLF
jgi:hypothetical protein